jgi:hypothetical protein
MTATVANRNRVVDIGATSVAEACTGPDTTVSPAGSYAGSVSDEAKQIVRIALDIASNSLCCWKPARVETGNQLVADIPGWNWVMRSVWL